MSTKNRLLEASRLLALILVSVMVIYPLIWMVLNSLKPTLEVFVNTWGLPQTVEWKNYSDAWTKNAISLGFMNTAIVGIISIPLVLLFSSMATFALSRFKFRGNSSIFVLFVAGNMLPQALILIPLFIHLHSLGLLNIPYAGLIIVYISFGFPFHILIQMPFFNSIPQALEEAAYMDGATVFDIFFKVDLPLAKTGIIIGGIFQFFYTWNEFIFAHTTIQSTKLRTLPLTIADLMLRQQQVAQWGSIFSGLVIAIIPCVIIYLIFQKQITKQAFLGALKG